jgi:putative CocE/NonD family hydrolase
MLSDFHYDQRVYLEMRDGLKLAGEVYRPGDTGKFPAIIMRTPYSSDGIIGGSSYIKVLPTVKAGYAIVIVYQRGRFGSEGKYDLTSPQDIEGPDCYDTVEWVAGQPWCDGNIGMAGESALGTVQWRTARENPPHLKAIAPGIAGAPGESGPEVADAPVNLNIAISLLLILAGDTLDKLDAQGKNTVKARQMLDQITSYPSLAYNYLPLKDVPQFNTPGIKDLWEICLHMGATRSKSSPAEPYPFHKVKVPSLNVTNWYDPFARNSFLSFSKMIIDGGSKYAREHQHILAGPYCHCRPQRVLGHLDFGPYAEETGSGVPQYLLSYFDKYLKGSNINLPAVHYFTIGSNVWHDADTWPLPQTSWQRLFLHSRGHANSCSGDGLLGRDEPKKELADTYTYDPLNPVPTAGGRGGIVENGFLYGPVDQVYIERRNDVLCYTTPELDQDIEVTGPLEFHLFASSSCQDTDFTLKLVDVYPDGRAFNVVDGITRAQHRNSFYVSELLKPGEITEFVMHLGHTSQLFRRGHRIRIDIASSNFPTFDRNMNTGNPIGVDAKGIPALQTIYHQAGYASYIDLPIIPPQKRRRY